MSTLLDKTNIKGVNYGLGSQNNAHQLLNSPDLC